MAPSTGPEIDLYTYVAIWHIPNRAEDVQDIHKSSKDNQDTNTSEATEKAIVEEYAKFTPLRNGNLEGRFYLWHGIHLK